uniref:G-protein coupled receptors family 1 profile domain-containing protein n=1 Tax=Latimeria chalumnae TaxID=7897 RepID=H3AIV6_LATCH
MDSISTLIIFGGFSILGVLGNCFLIFITKKDSIKLPAADIFVVHLASANLIYLFFRDLSLAVPLLTKNCLPFNIPCMCVDFVMHTALKLSSWCTLMLSVLRLCKLRKLYSPLWIAVKLENSSFFSLFVLFQWIFWAAAYVPFLILLPNNEIVNATICFCSITTVITTHKWSLETYRLFYLSFSEYLLLVLMAAANLHIIWVLLKRHRMLFAANQWTRAQNTNRELKAAKVILFLVVLYVTCWGIHALTQNIPETIALVVGHTASLLYSVFSPYIIGFGYQTFREKFKSMLTNPELNIKY